MQPTCRSFLRMSAPTAVASKLLALPRSSVCRRCGVRRRRTAPQPARLLPQRPDSDANRERFRHSELGKANSTPPTPSLGLANESSGSSSWTVLLTSRRLSSAAIPRPEPSCNTHPHGMLRDAPYSPQASDTNENVDRAVFDGLRRMTPLRRLEIAARAGNAFSRRGIGHSSCGPDHPNPTILLSQPFTQPSTHEPTSLQPRHSARNPAHQPDRSHTRATCPSLTHSITRQTNHH